jgi:DNA-binding beta-propeller fold protein YncE
MSTLNVSNITDGTDTVETGYVLNGSAKAWMTMIGDGSAIDDSLNTSSLTDNGLGDYTQNYTSSFANAHYSWCGQQESTYSTTAMIITYNHSSKLSSSTNFYTYRAGAGTSLEGEENCTQIQGDLA